MHPPIKRHNNFIYLTLALITLLLTPAFGEVTDTGLGAITLKIVAMGTLVIAFTSVSFASGWGRTVIVLLFLWITVSIADALFHEYDLDLIELAVLLTFFSGEAYYAAKLGLEFEHEGMDANLVASSISLYLLLGLIWTMVFLIALEFIPTSFSINFSESEHWSEHFHTMIYFTYVTMTSLGYGDISPTHPITQIFAVFTALSGTFYVAIVVATIVGVRNNQKDSHSEDS